MNPRSSKGLSAFGPLLAIFNAVLLASLLAWIALLHFKHTDSVPLSVVSSEIPEVVQEGDAQDDLPIGDDSMPEGYILEGDEAQPIDPVHLRARELFRLGRAVEALDLIEGLIARHPKDAVLRNDAGVYLSSLGEIDAAVASFTDAVRISPSYARAHYNQGTLLLKAGDFGAAVEAFGRALALNPYYGEARFNRALARNELGDTEGAVADYEFLTQSDQSGTSIKAYYNLGLIHMRAGRGREALRTFSAVLRKKADHVGARFNKALLLTREGLEDEAMAEYQKLLEVDPDHQGALLNAGAHALRSERWSDAIEYFEHLLAIDPESSRANYNLGLCHARMGEADESIVAFEAAIASDPAYAEARYNLGLSYLKAGRSEEAVEAFLAAVKLNPGRAPYHYNLALAYFEVGDLAQSIASYGDALAIRPDYYRARYNLGLAHLHLEDYPSAIEAFAQAEAIQPDSYPAIYNRGLALLKMNRPAEAEEALRAASRLEDTVEGGYNLGLALMRQGKRAASVEAFLAVLRSDPKHAASIERLAEVYSEGGSHDEALQKLVLLQKLVPEDPTAFNIGLGLFKQGESQLARRYFEISETSTGDLRRKSLSMQYQSLKQLGMVAEAIAVLERALPEYPRNEAFLRGLGDTLANSSRHEESIPYLEMLQAVNPGDPTAFNRGMRLYRAARYPLAIPLFEVAAKGEESIARKAMNMQGLTFSRLGDDANAVATFRTAIDRFPRYGPVARSFAETLSDLGRHREASEVLSIVASYESDPGRLADTLYRLGREQLALGLSERARESLEKALEVDKGHGAARALLDSMKQPQAAHSNP